MKIMFIWIPAGLDVYGGGEKVLSFFCDQLTHRNIEISILAMIGRKNEPQKKIWVSPFSTYHKNVDIGYLDGHYLFKYYKSEKVIGATIKKQNPDVIIISGNPFMINPVVKFLKKENEKKIITYWDHGFLPYFFSSLSSSGIYDFFWKMSARPFLRRSINLIDNYFIISSGIQDIIKKININADFFYTPNPSTSDNTHITISSYNNKNHLTQREKNNFLYVGRLDDKPKNISFLLKGLSKIRAGWTLTIIGDGPDKKRLERYAIKLGISENIIWSGFINNPFKNVENFDVLLLTSRYEGFSLVLVEAHQNGIPTISSDCCSGPKDIITPNSNGLLYKEGDLKDFVKKINQFINHDIAFSSKEEIKISALRYSDNRSIDSFISAINKIILKDQPLHKRN